jgi:hypothetical protein
LNHSQRGDRSAGACRCELQHGEPEDRGLVRDEEDRRLGIADNMKFMKTFAALGDPAFLVTAMARGISGVPSSRYA